MGTSRSQRSNRPGGAALLAAALVVVATLGAAPAAGADASPPTGIEGRPSAGRIELTWTAPPVIPGDPVQAYGICPSTDPTVPVATSVCFETMGPVTLWPVDGLAPGVTYHFRVRTRTSSGTGPWSAPTVGMVPMEMYAPFASWDGLVRQQLLDLTGDPGTVASRAATVEKLSTLKLRPADLIKGLLADPWTAQAVPPTTRLYLTFFNRIPDHRGLEHWASKRRQGTTLIRIAASFAASSEFQRTYGVLSDQAFVHLVYQRVLARPADPSGLGYWTRKLARGTSRGQVMVSFSESEENVRTHELSVGVVTLFDALLDRSPTPAELAPGQPMGTADQIDALRWGAEYADRVT